MTLFNFLYKLLFKKSLITKIKVVHSKAVVPKYAHPGDSGFDFYTIENVTIHPSETKLIRTGLIFELPENFELQVRPRSGISLKTNLRVANSPGTVDNAFRAEIQIIIQNTGDTIEIIEAGTRIAQGIISPVYRTEFQLVEEVSNTIRNTGGFGSSGLK